MKKVLNIYLKIILTIIVVCSIVIFSNNEINERASRLSFPKQNDMKEDKNIITIHENKKPSDDNIHRQKAVVAAFQHSWKGYKDFAWGHDNLKPISKSYHDWFELGLTIVDSLDTMYIMDLQEEYEEAKYWVENSLSFDVNKNVNLFEVTIRVLGGLLSIYHLSGDSMYIKKAVDLANRLMPCFDSPSSIPFSDINLATMKTHSPEWSDSSTSEVTTLQLEFRDLSRVTNDSSYEIAVAKVSKKVHELPKTDGLVPIFINPDTGRFNQFSTISLGARGDSYYEYLLKQWLQIGKKDDNYLIKDYQNAVEGVFKHLRRVTPIENHVYIGELQYRKFSPKMDHLVCFFPGTLLLGYNNGMPKSHLKLANELLETCYQTYIQQATKLAPEISYFNLDKQNRNQIYVKPADRHNLLRPEFIESLYYFWALTANKTYRDMGWEIFQAFEKYTKVTHGYTAINDVTNISNTRPMDVMESFWMAETLKYFYLLFSEKNKIDLGKYLFNTEGHLIPIRDN